MDVCKLAEEEPVSGGGIGDARTGHDRSVEGDEDAEGHGGGHDPRSGRSGDDSKRRDGGAFAGGDLAAGRIYWMAALVAMKRKPTMNRPPMRAMGRERSGRVTSPATMVRSFQPS